VTRVLCIGSLGQNDARSAQLLLHMELVLYTLHTLRAWIGHTAFGAQRTKHCLQAVAVAVPTGANLLKRGDAQAHACVTVMKQRSRADDEVGTAREVTHANVIVAKEIPMLARVFDKQAAPAGS